MDNLVQAHQIIILTGLAVALSNGPPEILEALDKARFLIALAIRDLDFADSHIGN